MLVIIKIFVWILRITIAALFAVISYKVLISQKLTKAIYSLKDKADQGMHNTKGDFFNYDRVKKYLSEYGVDYMFESKITPMMYFEIRFGIMFFVFIILSLKLTVFYGAVGGLAGFYFFDALIHMSNEMDNEKMMEDIKTMYDSIKIQTQAGVYLTNSLAECYICVGSARLKKALLELNNRIMTQKDIEQAIDEFNFKFHNEYIDAFCIVVKQSLESGQTVNALGDISNQISDVQDSINEKQRNRLERKVELLQLMIFMGIVAISIFYMISQVSLEF